MLFLKTLRALHFG